jgi:hypothetical protein
MDTQIYTKEPQDLADATVSDSDLVGFRCPSDIVHDPMLSTARKRQLLAFWGSDIHAVSGAPALRSSRYGPTVLIDEIKAALLELDGLRPETAAPRPERWSFRRGHWTRLGRRWRHGRDDDDDDDPLSPAPAAPRPRMPSLAGAVSAAA